MNHATTPVEPSNPVLPFSAPLPTKPPFYRTPSVVQFIKFCIVGASSTIVSFTLTNVLYRVLSLPLVSSLTTAFIVSVINGFLWNRFWTFKESSETPLAEQSLKFLAVNVVGWLLNTSIVVLIVAHAVNHGQGLFGTPAGFRRVFWAVLAGEGKKKFGFWLLNGALAAATCVVVFWNFFANRLWTFKSAPPGPLD